MATMSGAGLLVLLAAWDVQAFALGIALDGFIDHRRNRRWWA